MKKTITITIHNTPFTIEEDAYKALEHYLHTVKEHFASNTDKEEILKDIEARIAEQLTERSGPTVTLHEIETIIASMGNVEQFDTEDAQVPHSSKGIKRLYRSPDDALIAGVASGLSHYFGVDVAIIRIVLVVSIFFGGLGILSYFILWLAVPEAKKSSQKLEMKGTPITLATMSQTIKERMQEMEDRIKPNTRHGKSVFVSSLRGIGQFFQQTIIPILRTVIGLGLSIATFAGAVGITVGFGVLLFGIPTWAIDTPFIPLLQGPLFYLTLAALYLVILIPLIMLFNLGVRIIRKTRLISKPIMVTLTGIWVIAVVGTVASASRYAFTVRETIRTSPQFVSQMHDMRVGAFTSLQVQDGQEVTFIQGDIIAVSIEGRQVDIDRADIHTEGDTLIVGRKPQMRPCVFCFDEDIQIIVTAPDLSKITLQNASSVEGTLGGTELTIVAKNASRADLKLSFDTVHATLENSSALTLEGTADTATVELKNASRYNADTLVSQDVTITAQNASRADVMAHRTLSVQARNGSSIRYTGFPRITQTLSDGSSLESRTQ